MPYLVITLDGEAAQEETLHEDDVLDVVEGDVAIYRFFNGKFQVLTPIDAQDSNNWTDV